MGGLDDLLAESEDRWAAAERRSEGVADKGLGKALRIYFTLYFPPGLVLLFVIGFALGMLLFRGEWADTLSYLFLGTALAWLGAFIGGLVYNAKVVRPAVEMGRIGVLTSLTASEQKQLRREILTQIPVEPRHIAVKRAAAVQMRKGLATQLIVLAPIVEFQFLFQILNAKLSAWWWLMAVLAIAFAVSLVVPARQFRALGRFLARTSEPNS